MSRFRVFKRRTAQRNAKRARFSFDGLSDFHVAQIEERRSSALLHVQATPEMSERIVTAPFGYVVAHNGVDIARHMGLLTPLPQVGEVRVVVTPGRGPSEWHLDIASRDRRGLLAAFTGVLSRRHLDVVQAVIATWQDGAALEAFVIRSATVPEPAAIAAALEASLSEPIDSSPMFAARVSFDHDASPLYSRCDVRAPDRVGLLHSIAVAFAAAGVDVHAASVSTTDGQALDRFDLSMPNGAKLTPAVQALIEGYVRNGVDHFDGASAPKRGVRRGRAVPQFEAAMR